MKGKDILFSSDVQTYSTPQDFFDWVNLKYNFTLDACADRSNHKCKKYFTEEQNGLLQSWTNETVWVNPPYKYSKEWVKKSLHEVVDNNCNCVVLLIPARTDTILFHETVVLNATELIFIKGRLKFSGNKNSATFPSMLVIFDNNRGKSLKVSFIDYKEHMD
jgi:site-specific DNA-methyltransferase (adenine-specific)